MRHRIASAISPENMEWRGKENKVKETWDTKEVSLSTDKGVEYKEKPGRQEVAKRKTRVKLISLLQRVRLVCIYLSNFISNFFTSLMG